MNPKLSMWLAHVLFVAALAYFAFNGLIDWPTIIMLLTIKLEIQILAHYYFKDKSKTTAELERKLI